jgi:hypothetical protein
MKTEFGYEFGMTLPYGTRVKSKNMSLIEQLTFGLKCREKIPGRKSKAIFLYTTLNLIAQRFTVKLYRVLLISLLESSNRLSNTTLGTISVFNILNVWRLSATFHYRLFNLSADLVFTRFKTFDIRLLSFLYFF